MKAMILTIRLKYFYLTYKGIKTVEVRKTQPKDFKGNVYECVSKTNWKKDLRKIPEEEREFFKKFVGKVGLKFTLNKVEEISIYWKGKHSTEPYYKTDTLKEKELLDKSCLYTFKKMLDYVIVKGYAWHIDNLEIFDKPKELNEFYKVGHYEDLNDYFTDEKQINGKWCIPLKKAPQSWCYVEV